jgi:hypothetical protein
MDLPLASGSVSGTRAGDGLAGQDLFDFKGTELLYGGRFDVMLSDYDSLLPSC